MELPSQHNLFSAFRPTWAACCTLATFLAGCDSLVAQKDHQVSGQVITEGGAAMAQAQVRMGGNVLVPVDGNGSFSTILDAAPGSRVVAAFSAPGYATVYRAITARVPAMDLPAVRLRPVDKEVSVTLPAAGGAPAVASVTRGEGAVSLALGGNSVVLPSGELAQGVIQVSMTYWHPQEALDSAPGLLVANENATTVPLQTFGMASIELWQNGNLLQVAPGQSVDLSFTEPAGMQARLALAMPNLYVLDPNVGVWVYQGSTTDGVMAYDKTQGIFTAHLPHLSAWNVDGSMYPSGGGCVEGHVYDACNPGTPLTNTPISVWFLDAEETKDFSATTDGAGHYCISTPISDYEANYNLDNNETAVSVHYFVSSGSDINNTAQCDPLPNDCRTCDPFYESWASATSFCNKCEMIIPGNTGYQDPSIPVQERYADTCTGASDLTASLLGCHFCSGDPNVPTRCTLAGSDGQVTVGQCTTLQPLYMRPPNCNCQYVGATCGPNGSCCADVSGQQTGCSQKNNTCGVCNKKLGDVCSVAAGDICCGDPANGPLICADNVCVPARDPAFQE